GCQRISAGVGPTSLEIGDASAGLLHDDRWRRQVPGVELRLDHRLAGAFGDQRVAPEVPEPAVAPRSIDHAIEGALLAHGFERRARGVEDLRVPELRDPGYVESPLSRPGAAAAGRVPALAHRGRGHDPELHDAGALEGDQDGEYGNAPQVAVGRVDGIDDPSGLLLGGSIAELLREHAVPGITTLDPFAHGFLHGGIGLGHERAIRLPIDAQVTPKI